MQLHFASGDNINTCNYPLCNIFHHRTLPGCAKHLMWRNDSIVRVEPHLVPELRDAVQQFESLGGHLTLFSPFGEDPLKDRADLISQRETEYSIPDFGPIFHSLVNGDCNLFRCGLLFLSQASKCLESQL